MVPSSSVMDNLVVTAASRVTDSDLRLARLGARSARLDWLSRLALMAVESLGLNFDAMPRDRIGICLAARAGSLSTDMEYWKGRALVGGPSPTLFAYTLPSAAIGEIAIRHRLTGPNLCFVGEDTVVLPEAADLIRRGEADGCVCVSCNLVTVEAADILQTMPVASACALFLTADAEGLHCFRDVSWRDISRDMESLCATVCSRKSPT